MFAFQVQIGDLPPVVAGGIDMSSLWFEVSVSVPHGGLSRVKQASGCLGGHTRLKRSVDAVDWWRLENLKVGDRFAIDVIEADEASPEISRLPLLSNDGRTSEYLLYPIRDPVRSLGFKFQANDEPPVVAGGSDLSLLQLRVAVLFARSTNQETESLGFLLGSTSAEDGAEVLLDWWRRERIEVGDRFTMEVVETDHPSREICLRPRT